VNAGNIEANEWFKSRYSFKTFEVEYKIFYPIIWLFFLLFEIIPHYIFGDKLVRFEPKSLKERMREILKD